MALKKTNTGGKGSKPPRTPMKSPSPGTISQNAIDATNASIGRGAAYGQGLVDKFYPSSVLANTQVDASRAPETQGMLNRFTDVANTNNGMIPAAQQSYLNQQQQIAQNGYTAPQFNALYEQTRGDQSQQNQGMQRALAQQIGQSGVHGAAAGAQYNQLAQQQMMNNRKLNQGLYNQGMQYQTNALNQYGQDLGQFSQNAFNNQQQSLANLNAATTGAQANEYDRQKYNIDAYNKYQAGQMGTYTGGIGAYTGEEAKQYANEQAQRNTDWARAHYKSGSVG